MTRPRDRLGRPLSADTDPSEAFPGVPERSQVSAHDAWHEALAYLDAGLPFHAHETFEQRWRCAPAHERAVWQALAQWGAALTHAARGNPRGARVVARRALVNLNAPSIVVPDVVAVTRVRDSLNELVN